MLASSVLRFVMSGLGGIIKKPNHKLLTREDFPPTIVLIRIRVHSHRTQRKKETTPSLFVYSALIDDKN